MIIISYTKNVWIEDGLSEAQKVTFMNNLETAYDQTIDTVLAHRHDSIYYTKTVAATRFFGPSHKGAGSGMNAGKVDGYTADDIISSSIPSGFIVMYASTSYVLPGGWTEYTDINGKFPVGAGTTFPVKSTGGSSYSVNPETVSAVIGSHALDVSEMPTHNHIIMEWNNPDVHWRKNDSNQVVCYTPGSRVINTDYAQDGHGVYANGTAHSHNGTASINSIDHTPPYMILKYIKKT